MTYFCYIDESGTPEVPGTSTHFVLVGLAIPIQEWSRADQAISAILRRCCAAQFLKGANGRLDLFELRPKVGEDRRIRVKLLIIECHELTTPTNFAIWEPPAQREATRAAVTPNWSTSGAYGPLAYLLTVIFFATSASLGHTPARWTQHRGLHSPVLSYLNQTAHDSGLRLQFCG